MSKKKLIAKERAGKLLETNQLTYGPQGQTYQLHNKETGKLSTDPMQGVDVGSGLLSRGRRMNKLIGRELVLQNSYQPQSGNKNPNGDAATNTTGSTAGAAGTNTATSSTVVPLNGQLPFQPVDLTYTPQQSTYRGVTFGMGQQANQPTQSNPNDKVQAPVVPTNTGTPVTTNTPAVNTPKVNTPVAKVTRSAFDDVDFTGGVAPSYKIGPNGKTFGTEISGGVKAVNTDSTAPVINPSVVTTEKQPNTVVNKPTRWVNNGGIIGWLTRPTQYTQPQKMNFVNPYTQKAAWEENISRTR